MRNLRCTGTLLAYVSVRPRRCGSESRTISLSAASTCITDNHVHLVASPEEPRSLPHFTGGPLRWAALLAEPEELIDIRALQRGTYSGRPLGSDGCVTALEQTLHRRLRSQQGQRPPLSAAHAML
ncbi:MAG: hypothetical protein WBW33_12070 [Bryobacteraceae bacterium]